MGVEYFLREEAFTTPLARNEELVAVNRLSAEQNGERCKIFLGRGFIKGYANRIRVDNAEQTAALIGFVSDLRSLASDLDRNRIEQAIACNLDASSLKPSGEARSKASNTRCNGLQARRTVPDGIRCGHIGEQCLRGANVRRRFVAADMLFAGLERQTVGGAAVRIGRLADNAARDDARQRTRHNQICCVWTTKSPPPAITLHGANGHIGTPACWSFHDGQ